MSTHVTPGSRRRAPAAAILAIASGALALQAGPSAADTIAPPPAPAASLQGRLVAPDGAFGDQLGRSVAISGNTALAGAVFDDVGTNADQGSATVFVRDAGAWTAQFQLIAPDGAPGDRFGRSVALAGDTAVVGADGDDTGRGAVYVFVRSGTTWFPQARIVAPDRETGDFFGNAVALGGDTLLIGANGDDNGLVIEQGSVHVFVRANGTWTQQAKLLATDGSFNDVFGWSVAVSGDTALIGAYRDRPDDMSDRGSAYVFTRSGTAWTQATKLVAADGAPGHRFGHAVALDAGTAVIGAPGDGRGSARVFVGAGSNWTPQATLAALAAANTDNFGTSVAVSGDTAIAGSFYDNIGGLSSVGSAFAFVRSGSLWSEHARLQPDAIHTNLYFGNAVALSGGSALIGAVRNNVDGNVAQGSAWVFTGLPTPPSLVMFGDGFE